MKKRITAIVVASALTLTIAGPTFAAGNGRMIQDSCGANFGTLVRVAKSIGHIDNAAGGANAFAGTLAIHCPAE